jgi:hypothetical protein
MESQESKTPESKTSVSNPYHKGQQVSTCLLCLITILLENGKKNDSVFLLLAIIYRTTFGNKTKQNKANKQTNKKQ